MMLIKIKREMHMRLLIVLFLIYLMNSPVFSQNKKVFNGSEIDSIVDGFKNKWEIPGISLAIAKDGRLFMQKVMVMQIQ